MRSLRAKLTLTHASVALLALMLGCTLSIWLINRGFRQLSQVRAERDAAQIAEVLSRAYTSDTSRIGQLPALRRFLHSADLPLFLRTAPVIVADAQGRVILDRLGNLEGRPLPAQLRSNAAPILVDGQSAGFVVLPVERRDLNIVERTVVLRVYVGVACSSILAGLVALLVGLAISKRLITPLRSLTIAATRVAGGERLDPLPLAGEAEIDELARAFNTMARQLEHQEQLRRNLIADIAHELRTPLSVLRLQVEALHDGVASPGAASFASLQEEVALLGHLVDDLRLLSLADAGQLQVAIEPISAAAVARRVLMIAELRARAQQVRLECQAPDNKLLLYADPQRIVQVLGGLIDNALRYTPAGGRVALRVAAVARLPAVAGQELIGGAQPVNGFVVFAVEDSGTGIAAADLPYVFERFYRADPARARETGGSGLGLAIAQRLVEAMHGRIWAESPPGQGARFYVALPAASADHALLAQLPDLFAVQSQ